MNPKALDEADDHLRSAGTPHLSYSRINRYLQCPEQYRLYYIENLRPRIPPANLIFGQLVHNALAHYFNDKVDPVQFFAEAWHGLKSAELGYGARDSWSRLESIGCLLLTKFVREECPKISRIVSVEKSFELDITSLDLPLVGIIDLTAEVEGKNTVVDFKTSASSYDEHEAVLSDQLTAYQLAVPDAERVALCVLVKTKEPRIEWHATTRSTLETNEFLAKAGHIAREILAGHFYKRPGKWCSWCDFLPVCLRDEAGVKETLIKAA